MSGCSARDGRKEKRRDAIMQAAFDLFMQHGYSNVSMTDIIRRSGGSLATAYDLFENKNGLLRELVSESAVELHRTIAGIAATSGPPEEVLKRTARDLLHTLLDSNSMSILKMTVIESQRDPGFGPCLRSCAPELSADALSEVFKRWNSEGLLAVDNPRTAAESFFALLFHKVLMSALCGLDTSMTDAEMDRHITHVVGMICCRYGIPPASAPAAGFPLSQE